MAEKNKQIAIRLSEEEADKIKAEAEKIGMSISDYVRNTAAHGIDQITYDPEIYKIIAGIHENNRCIATAIQDAMQRNADSLGDIIAIRLCEDQLRELNKKMRYVEETMKKIESVK